MRMRPAEAFTQKHGETPGHFLLKGMMTDIQKRQRGVQGTVVFHVAGNEDIRACLGGGLDEGSAGTGTIGDALEGPGLIHRRSRQARKFQADMPGKPGKQPIKGERLGQIPHTTAAPEGIRLSGTGFKHAHVTKRKLLRQPAGRAVHGGVQRGMGRVEGHIRLEKQRERFMVAVKDGGKAWREQQGMMGDHELRFKLHCASYGRRAGIKAEGKTVYGVIATGALHAAVVPVCRAAQRSYFFYYANYFI